MATAPTSETATDLSSQPAFETPATPAKRRKTLKSGGGWQAVMYSLKLSARYGPIRMWKAMRSQNTCKTCAVGMGGQTGGMVNEGGHFPEVCKKSFQAMASDLQEAIPESFFADMTFPKLRAMTPRQLEHAGRLTQPMYAGPDDDRYRPISWDEALDKTADALRRATAERSFFYASGRSSNEAGFLLQLLARQMGSNYVNNCSYYCHQATGAGLASAVGSGVGTIRLEDLDGCDLYVLIGANPASNHPRLMTQLMHLKRRGGRVVVVNPLKEVGLVNFKVPSDVRSMLFGTEIADLYIQPHIGGDLALMTGVAKAVLADGTEDADFLRDHTEGFARFQAMVDQTDWDEIVDRSGVDRATIETLARWYGESKASVFAWAMGITHHANGVQNVQMIANLACLRGMVGREDAGLMPLRGHSNVQGVGSVGVTPTLKKAILERYEQRLGIAPPSSPGYDTMQCMHASHRGEMDAALMLGGNLYGSNPDSQFAGEALQKIGLTCVLSTTLNTHHAHGRSREMIVLPVLPRDEEPQATTQESMFSYVRMSEGGQPRFEGPRSEVSILTELGRRVLGDESAVDWTELQSHAAVRDLIADLIPGYEKIGRMDERRLEPDETPPRFGFGNLHVLKPLHNKGKDFGEFHVGGRHPRGGKFNTDSGRAQMHAIPLPPADHDRLQLMTIRSEGQFNTVVYEEHDLYRGQERRDVVLMNAADMDRLGLQPDQPVRIASDAGEMRHVRARVFDVRAGNVVMYYPEANVLVSKEVDPISKTPAFKKTPVTITAEELAIV